ncbi:MAG: phosphoadenosine phosphosulfate reductase, partial [Chloroflexota bacterium]
MTTTKALLQTLSLERTDGLAEALEATRRALDRAYKAGLTRWVVMYSGGKDSTTLLVNVLEWHKANPGALDQLHVIYADTQVEIPTLRAFAARFLQQVRDRFPEVNVHEVHPGPEKSFWVLLIGKGYPPPHQRFRWCTSKLKIQPAEKVIRQVAQVGPTAVLTGVRLRESDVRDRRLLLSCNRGGECGQGIWLEESARLGVTYLAPIASWRECLVWDFLNYEAPSLGYPTMALEDVYQGAETRFGCWVCTVVRQDRAMQKITATPTGARWLPLLGFREWLLTV